jgi:hypothetical protein
MKNHCSIAGPVRGSALCLTALAFSANQAYGYTDPGTGALIWQIVMAGAVGALFYVRRFTSWVRLRRRNKVAD